MTYLALNLTVLATLIVVLNLFMRKTPWASVGYTMLALLALTAIFDNVIILLKVVGYDPAKIMGWFVGVAPVEDFAYTIAAVLLVPALWNILNRNNDEKGKND